jgi:hypothetical protein
MKTDFSINVQVNLGVTPEVVQLVTAILQPKGWCAPIVDDKPNNQVEAKETPAEDEKPASQTRKPKTESRAAQTGKAEDEVKPNGQDTAKESIQADKTEDKAKSLTEEDVRAAMHQTRLRIEGEDYKENTSGELYKKYHKELSTQFKQIAAFLGAEKPSLLPADKRQAFIDECAKLKILNDGTIGNELPF